MMSLWNYERLKNSLSMMKKRIKHRICSFKALINGLKKLIRNNILSISIVILSIISWFSPKQFPNLLSIKDTPAIITVLSRIAGVLASILGIVVAMLLVAFEILRRTYAYYAFKEFFQLRKVNQLFTLYISTILISIVSIASMGNSLSIRNFNLSYLSIILFSICIVILYPYSKAIIISTKSKAKIKEIVDRINFEAIIPFNYFRRQVPASVYISAIEENPIFVLSEVAIRTIKEDDRLTPKLILSESTKKLLDLVNQTEGSYGHRDSINAFLIIIRNSASQAIVQRQQGTLQTVLEVIEQIHSFCAKKKIAWHELIELNETLQEILEQTIEANLDEVARHGLWTIARIFMEHLQNNIPQESEIWSLHVGEESKKDVKDDTDKELQWQHVRDEYIRMLSQLTEKAIELKKGQLVSSGLYCLTLTASNVIKTSDLGNLQKMAIVKWCYYYAKTLTLKCVDEGLYSRVPGLSPFHSLYINDALDKNAEFLKEPLLRFSETLIQLAQKDVLDIAVLNELGTIGRGSVREIDNSVLHAESLLFICKVFDKIREILSGSDRAENRRVYLEVYRQVESLNKWMESENKHNNVIEQEISSILKKFDKLDEYKKNYEGEIIKWPTLNQKN